jgi:HSF-type DNA-binding
MSKLTRSTSLCQLRFFVGSSSAVFDTEQLEKPETPSWLLTMAFPLKIRVMLDFVHDQGLEDIVSWTLTGKAFKVHKPEEFECRIMPSFFSQTKYKSFQRQLNLYGFDRIPGGLSKGCYLHKLFLRENPSLCQGISKKVLGPQASATCSPASIKQTLPLNHSVVTARLSNANSKTDGPVTCLPKLELRQSSHGTGWVPSPIQMIGHQYRRVATDEMKPQSWTAASSSQLDNFFQSAIVKPEPSACPLDGLLQKQNMGSSECALERMLDSLMGIKQAQTLRHDACYLPSWSCNLPPKSQADGSTHRAAIGGAHDAW